MSNKEQLAMEEKERGDTLFEIFGFLLVASICLYVALHWWIPAPGVITPETQAKDSALKTIAQATDVLNDNVPLVAAHQVLSNTMATLSNTLASTMNMTTSAAIDAALATGSQGLDQALRSSQKTQIQAMLPALNDSIRSVVLFRTNSIITSTLKSIEDEIAKPEPQAVKLQLLLEQLDTAIRNNSERYFWSDGFGRWIEFLFWGWFGTLVFILMEIRFWYRDVLNRQFIEFTPWYIEVALRGPLTSLLIMFFLTNVEVGALGATFSLKTSAIELQIFVAAILGFYSRIAKTELDTIVSRIFPDAWKENQAKKSLVSATISIDPPKALVPLGESKQFEIFPRQSVNWKLESQGLGTFDNGKYTAPDDSNLVGETAVIKATAAIDKTQVAVALVTIVKKFTITPAPPIDVKFGETQKFTTDVGRKVKWSIKESDRGKIGEDDGRYEAPSKASEKAKAGDQVTIVATLEEDDSVTAEATVTLAQ